MEEKWKIRENTPRHIADNNTEIIIEGSGAVIARMNDGWDNPTIQANAERIVKAVNCHDDLVEALRRYAVIVGNTTDGIDKNQLYSCWELAQLALAEAL